MDGRDLFFIDFCYDRPRMNELAKVAKSLTVLDHHEGVKAVATAFPGVFDSDQSGATIAWKYFHPDTPVPEMLSLLQDYDLFRFSLPDTKAFNAFIIFEPHEFERWDEIARAFEDPEARADILARGKIYAEHTDKLVEYAVMRADLVEFEGHTVYLSGTGIRFLTDYVGHQLSMKQPPFALVVRPVADGLHVSLRGDGAFDVATIARRFGGNGHPGAAGFRLSWNTPIPWKPTVEEHENPGR